MFYRSRKKKFLLRSWKNLFKSGVISFFLCVFIFYFFFKFFFFLFLSEQTINYLFIFSFFFLMYILYKFSRKFFYFYFFNFSKDMYINFYILLDLLVKINKMLFIFNKYFLIFFKYQFSILIDFSRNLKSIINLLIFKLVKSFFINNFLLKLQLKYNLIYVKKLNYELLFNNYCFIQQFIIFYDFSLLLIV